MDFYVFLVVLSAALMHAAWNSIIQSSSNSFLESFNFAIWKVPLTLVLIILLPIPHSDSWPYIAASIVVHFIYTYSFVYTYTRNELSQVYPIFRGAPPLIILLLSYFVLKENISSTGWIAVIITSLGIISMSFMGSKINFKSSISITIVAFAIVAYSMIDGMGARLSLQSFSYLAWVFFIHWSIYSIFVVYQQGYEKCINHVKAHYLKGIFAGGISFLGYSLILWAMTKAPIPYVAALRETSIIFVGIIGYLFLSEKMTIYKLLSLLTIVIGAMLLRLA
jgi:drug/metabolite transporter (DMT)-like permease